MGSVTLPLSSSHKLLKGLEVIPSRGFLPPDRISSEIVSGGGKREISFSYRYKEDMTEIQHQVVTTHLSYHRLCGGGKASHEAGDGRKHVLAGRAGCFREEIHE